MKRGLILLGHIAALVALADGIAMVLTESTSTAGGVALIGVGGLWFGVALPRLMEREARPFVSVLAPKTGARLLPLLFLPVLALWAVATPEALTAWFGAAWGGLWVACLAASVVLPCPSCGHAFGRDGPRMRPLAHACAHCGVRPASG